MVVVVNQNSTNSVELGNYYCQKRQVPPQNMLRINWSGSRIQWTASELTTALVNPLTAMLQSRELTNQIDFVLLSMDIPYRVTQGGDSSTAGVNSTTAALLYGFKPDGPLQFPGAPISCNLPDSATNSYAGSEAVFRFNPPDQASGTPLLAMMLTGETLAQARTVIDQGVSSDGSFPVQTAYLVKSVDLLRNVRYANFDDAAFNTQLLGFYLLKRTNNVAPYQLGRILGYQGGSAVFSAGLNVFSPGAMADQLTSFGGYLFEYSGGQTTLLEFLKAGASASYGTIVEPCNWLEKFPNAQNYFYQARGFSLAESYYQSLAHPYQGVLVGEPLAAPFATPSTVQWQNPPPDAVLTGSTPLSLMCSAASSNRPVAQVDLFVDGTFLRTLTNIAPRAGNSLSVTLNGHQVAYSVPANATLSTIAEGMSSSINSPAHLNQTKVKAYPHGDRVELQSTPVDRSGTQVAISSSSAVEGAATLTSFIRASGAAMLDGTSYPIRSFIVTNQASMGDYLSLTVFKTNGTTTTVSATNHYSTNNLSDLGKALATAVNSSPELQSPDGVIIEDMNMHEDLAIFGIYAPDDYSGEFNIRARSSGLAASQVRVQLGGSSFQFKPSGINFLDQNLSDLQPRAHLYLSAGVTSLPLEFTLDSNQLADGYHELTAIAYEGTHVRTQGRAARRFRVQNSGTSAVLTSSTPETVPVSSDLVFTVNTSGAAATRLELFSTGGSIGTAANQSSATFTVPASALGQGLHPFYAIVSFSGGTQFRTDTIFKNIANTFPITLSSPPPTLHWPAEPGKNYEILGSSDANAPFQVLGTASPVDTNGTWTDPAPARSEPRFYRVRRIN